MSTEEGKPVGEETPHLSGRQKRELLQLAAAGLVSAVFFAVPVLVVDRNPARQAVQTKPREIDPAAPAARVAVARVTVVTTEVAAAVTTPALQPRPSAVSAVQRRPAPPPQRVATAAAHTRRPLIRRLARLIAGNGNHDVRPFPAVTAAQR